MPTDDRPERRALPDGYDDAEDPAYVPPPPRSFYMTASAPSDLLDVVLDAIIEHTTDVELYRAVASHRLMHARRSA